MNLPHYAWPGDNRKKKRGRIVKVGHKTKKEDGGILRSYVAPEIRHDRNRWRTRKRIQITLIRSYWEKEKKGGTWKLESY